MPFGPLRNMSDIDLIGELRRRKRIRVVTSTTTFYNEFSEDSKYTETMDSELVKNIARSLLNDLRVNFDDRVVLFDADDRPVRSTRTATLAVLIAEDAGD